MESSDSLNAREAALRRLALSSLRFKRRTVQAPPSQPNMTICSADPEYVLCLACKGRVFTTTVAMSFLRNSPQAPLILPALLLCHPSRAPSPLARHAHRPRTWPLCLGSRPTGVPQVNNTHPCVWASTYACCTAPTVCKAHEAKVASHGIFDHLIVTLPNMDYIASYPVETQVIHTYSDGLWGPHEYSRFPQRLVPGRWHVACIPSAASPPDIPDVLFMSLSPAVDWKEDLAIGFGGLGYIEEDTRRHLEVAAASAIRRTEETTLPSPLRKYGGMLVMILRQVLDRMRYLPASANISIAVAAHVQRLCLELAGLKTYADIVAPRLATAEDYSLEILPVVGAFVVDGSDAQNATRVGLPTWFLQPFTPEMPVWAVVEPRDLPLFISRRVMDPPILHAVERLVGVGNLTGNWQEGMLLRVSRHVAGTHLASLSLMEVPSVPEREVSKRARVEEEDLRGTHYRMSPANPVVAETLTKRTHRSRHGRSGAAITPGGNAPNPFPRPTSQADKPHPSKSLTDSPFYDYAESWRASLRAASPVPRSASSATYFYPPPFLLDTVSSIATLPKDILRTERARSDEKIHRYLHNLVRIRPFLRARLFDPSLSHEPLSIAEWRAALWGDYQMKTYPPRLTGSRSDLRRAQRRQGDRNGVTRLFTRVAMLRSYSADQSVAWGSDILDLRQVATDTSLRRRLLWESHEINFRAEIMALDTLLVHKSSWLEVHRWEREALVSTVWGPPSSAVTVLPPEDQVALAFRWQRPSLGQSDRQNSVDTLFAFARVLRRWPDCPDAVVEAVDADPNAVDMERVQSLAIEFYVRTFVKHYCRLPVPPIPYYDPM